MRFCLWSILTLCLALLVAAPTLAQEIPAVAERLSELIRINSENPPGGEAEVARYLAEQLRPAGFEIDIVDTPEPGKAHLIARLTSRGDGHKEPILLAAHADVVGVEREKWTREPFAGEIEGGWVYGRGAIDFKGGLAVFTEAVLRLARAREKGEIELVRDVILLSEADEEGGRYGVSWLAQDHWEKIRCELALNEGGWILRRPDAGEDHDSSDVQIVTISTIDKSSLTVRLTTRGTSSHSSLPRPDNAISRLARAITRLSDQEPPRQLVPLTRAFFTAMAESSTGDRQNLYRDLVSREPERAERAERVLRRDPLTHALLRNTVAPVVFDAGFRHNVIPGSAEAFVNLRLLPGSDPAEVVEWVRTVVDDPEVEVGVRPYSGRSEAETLELMKRLTSGTPGSTDNPLYRALESSARSVWPRATVTPTLFQAGTDAATWRQKGIPVYGIYPYPVDPADIYRMHGNDERVRVQALVEGVDYVYRTLLAIATEK